MYLFIAFRLCVFAPIHTTAVYSFCLRWTATFENVLFALLLSSPYLSFDPLKILLLFVFFLTSTLTVALGGGLHVSFAFVGKRYTDTAFSFLTPMVARYFAFVTKAQCGLLCVLCPVCGLPSYDT